MNARKREFSTPKGRFGVIFAFLILVYVIFTESLLRPTVPSDISVKSNGDGSSQITACVVG